MSPILKDLDDGQEVMMEKRMFQPSAFMVNIESFPRLLEHGIDMFECGRFEAGRHEWKLIIIPNGRYISVYLSVAKQPMSRSLIVNTIISIFIYNQMSQKYSFMREVFILQKPRIERLSLMEVTTPTYFRLPVNGYSAIKDKRSIGDFRVGDYRWEVCLYPEGYGDAKGQYVSIFLYFHESIPSHQKVNANFTIWVENHCGTGVQSHQANYWFTLLLLGDF